MSVKPRGLGYQADFMIAGKRVREQFPTAEEAAAFEAAYRAAVKLGKPLPERPSVVHGTASTETVRGTLGDVFDTALATRWADRSDTQPRNARLFLKWAGGRKVAASDVLHQTRLAQYVAYLRDERRVGGGTINRHMSAVSCLVKIAYAAGFIDRLPLIGRQREAEGRTFAFTEAQAQRIIDTSYRLQFNDLGDFATFLLWTGCRPGEAMKLAWGDVNWSIKAVTFRDTKSPTLVKGQRTVLVNATVMAVLQRRRAAAIVKPFAGVTPETIRRWWGHMRQALPDIVTEHAVPYSFRHTNATMLAEDGLEGFLLGDRLGHKSTATTRKYVHTKTESQRAALDILERRLGRPE